MTQMPCFDITDATPVVETLVTHSGRFHADDLLAYGLLSTLHPRADLLRTRDPELISAHEGRAIIFDVGDVFDAARLRFDHHQQGRATRPDGVPYSSFGLIWMTFGRAFLAHVMPEAGNMAEQIHARAAESFVRDIDAGDNGQVGAEFSALTHRLSLPLMLETLAPVLDGPDPEREDATFRDASRVALTLFMGFLRKLHQEIEADVIVREAIANRRHPNWIELPRMMPYLGTVLASGETDIHYVVGPAPGEWVISAVNVSEGSFECRRPLPEAWAGLRDDKLRAATGVADARFCHLARFIAVAESREGAMALLEQALDA